MALFRRKKIFLCLSLLFLILLYPILSPCDIVYANSDRKIYLGGIPAGFSLETKGAYVAGVCDVVTQDGVKSPSKDAGIVLGDYIISIDGVEVNSAFDIEKAVVSDGYKDVLIDRCGIIMKKSVMPAKDLGGKFRLGVFVRDSVSGIGTITFFKDGKYASLGHPVLDDNGLVLSVLKGNVYPCEITGYIKGERGIPGELKGVFIKNSSIGNIEKNIRNGVYGKLEESFDFSDKTEIEVGEAKIGKASIFTTIEGDKPQEYSISIVKTDGDVGANKNYVIKVTDKTLLDKTGGIVQGMSGSPIVQDGKLVGAVTHVFINDPTRGFGISIKNMINNL